MCVYVCSIQALLSAPNPDDPLADNVAKHWKEDEKAAIETGEQQHDLLCVTVYRMGLDTTGGSPADSPAAMEESSGRHGSLSTSRKAASNQQMPSVTATSL